MNIFRVQPFVSNNGYDNKTIDKAIYTCKTQPQRRTKRTPTTRMMLPFIDDQLTSAVQAVIRGSGQQDLGVTWTNGNTIKRQLVRSALQPPPCPGGKRCHACAAGLQGRCHTSGVVYQLTCTLCQKTYIGETGRMVRLRYNEHLRDAKNKRRDSPWGEHFLNEHRNSQPDPKSVIARIIQVCSKERDRKIAESLHIKANHPAINSNIASWAIL